jgi:hypothetical protein
MAKYKRPAPPAKAKPSTKTTIKKEKTEKKIHSRPNHRSSTTNQRAPSKDDEMSAIRAELGELRMDFKSLNFCLGTMQASIIESVKNICNDNDKSTSKSRARDSSKPPSVCTYFNTSKGCNHAMLHGGLNCPRLHVCSNCGSTKHGKAGCSNEESR